MDEYEVLEQIGKGAFGSALLVRHKQEKKKYVLKKIRLARQTDRCRRSAHQEMELISRVRNPYIVEYKDSWVEKGCYVCIIIGYCEGGDMAQAIKKANGVLFPEERLCKWLTQLLMALDYLHSNHILHRDVKCSNIFLTKDRDIRLGDFGLAKILTSDGLANSVVGTPSYMCPELLADIPYGTKSDIWSLGCCIYEMTAHKPAFKAFDMQSLINKINKSIVAPLPTKYSGAFRGLVKSMLRKSPEHRPSAADLLKHPVLQPYALKIHLKSIQMRGSLPFHLHGYGGIIDDVDYNHNPERRSCVDCVDNFRFSEVEDKCIPANPEENRRSFCDEKILRACDPYDDQDLKFGRRAYSSPIFLKHELSEVSDACCHAEDTTIRKPQRLKGSRVTASPRQSSPVCMQTPATACSTPQRRSTLPKIPRTGITRESPFTGRTLDYQSSRHGRRASLPLPTKASVQTPRIPSAATPRIPRTYSTPRTSSADTGSPVTKVVNRRQPAKHTIQLLQHVDSPDVSVNEPRIDKIAEFPLAGNGEPLFTKAQNRKNVKSASAAIQECLSNLVDLSLTQEKRTIRIHETPGKCGFNEVMNVIRSNSGGLGSADGVGEDVCSGRLSIDSQNHRFNTRSFQQRAEALEGLLEFSARLLHQERYEELGILLKPFGPGKVSSRETAIWLTKSFKGTLRLDH
ncbi:serine/threonine-protein kinase Nek1-like isoform X2 [Nymphaea colorata]|nr:serine/threonine-protein kinase Nek1-like isoform X2 [Nymphaea colorata]XP_031492529.1 serine/threonine-protein kinase Nek1-like isoform X2 [Nymphaea colorata]XP_031492538.1 serine/threonine-protein kinase Nek1-like isoform X2 [Nymphaea colorata]